MKTSLKSCLSAVVIATAAMAVAASVAAAPSGKPGRQPALNRAKVAVTAKKLGLTADQKGSFKNIRKQTSRGEVLNVLTPGQQTEAKEILKRLRTRDGSGG